MLTLATQSVHLSLCLLGGRAVGAKQVVFVEVVRFELLGLHVANGLIADWYTSERLYLQPTHQVLSSTVFIQVDLE